MLPNTSRLRAGLTRPVARRTRFRALMGSDQQSPRTPSLVSAAVLNHYNLLGLVEVTGTDHPPTTVNTMGRYHAANVPSGSASS